MAVHLLLFLILVSARVGFGSIAIETGFDKYYAVEWGTDHFKSLKQGTEIELSMDNSSGAGFASKMTYGSGFFDLKIKLPNRDTAGVITAFYLSSYSSNHDELDFEFLGDVEGKPYTLQTNVFANGVGNREQRMHLWFDPTLHYHTYQILWNPSHIVFFVDKIPIRVFKNKTTIGVDYPSQAMKIVASLWDGEDWATDGGKTKTNWTYAPFKAYFQGFEVDGCQSNDSSFPACSSAKYWWNNEKYNTLNKDQEEEYQHVKKTYITYDYCYDKSRFPTPPPECPQ